MSIRLRHTDIPEFVADPYQPLSVIGKRCFPCLGIWKFVIQSTVGIEFSLRILSRKLIRLTSLNREHSLLKLKLP